MSFVGQRAGPFDRAGLPANGAQALRAEPRTVVRQAGSARRYPIRGEPGPRLGRILGEQKKG
jgi:hypothetical protein